MHELRLQRKVIDDLLNSSTELKATGNQILRESYQNRQVLLSDRNFYEEIVYICHTIIKLFKKNNEAALFEIFNTVEALLDTGEERVKEFVIVGLLEGIQNIASGDKLDYHKGFDRFLQPKSKKAWDELINSWEN